MAGQYRAFSGARAKILYDGKEAGWAREVTIQETIRNDRVDVLGNIYSEDIEAVAVTVTVRMGFVHISGKSLRAMGIWPQGDTLTIANWPEATIELYDPEGDKPLFRVIGAKPADHTVRLDRNGVTMVDATWDARRLVDETGA